MKKKMQIVDKKVSKDAWANVYTGLGTSKDAGAGTGSGPVWSGLVWTGLVLLVLELVLLLPRLFCPSSIISSIVT